MIKKNQRYLNWINRLSDMALLYMSLVSAVQFWIFYLNHDTENIAVRLVFDHPYLMFAVTFSYVLVFQYGGVYDSYRTRSVLQEMSNLFKYFALATMFFVGLIFLFKLSDYSRGVIVCAIMFAGMLLCAKRVALRGILRSMRKRGFNLKTLLIVGDGELAYKYLCSIKDNPYLGFCSLGFVGEQNVPGLGDRLGGYKDFEEVLMRVQPDEVVVALDSDEAHIMQIVSCCETQGVRANIVPIYSDYLPDSAVVETHGDLHVICTRACPLDVFINRLIKRSLDIVFSVLVLTLALPIFLLIALGVKTSSPGPVFFSQTRVGINGKPFMMLKFRSMYVNEDCDTTWGGKHDSRTTRFGSLIRKLSLDELPQFFNVLRGDMSVVGPRPERPYFVEIYRHTVPKYMLKHQVKPGITGWAQVNGLRGDTSIPKRIRYDIWYIENWTLFLDIRIVLMTVFGGMINRVERRDNVDEARGIT